MRIQASKQQPQLFFLSLVFYRRRESPQTKPDRCCVTRLPSFPSKLSIIFAFCSADFPQAKPLFPYKSYSTEGRVRLGRVMSNICNHSCPVGIAFL